MFEFFGACMARINDIDWLLAHYLKIVGGHGGAFLVGPISESMLKTFMGSPACGIQ